MSIQVILLPLFVEVVLTLVIVTWLALARRDDLRSGVTRPEQIALREPNWSPRTLKITYSFSNQFELPVLFYVLTILEIVTRHADLLFVVLAWIFVLSRIAHAYEHTTRNVPIRRGGLYGIGMMTLMVMWLIFIVRILFGLP